MLSGVLPQTCCSRNSGSEARPSGSLPAGSRCLCCPRVLGLGPTESPGGVWRNSDAQWPQSLGGVPGHGFCEGIPRQFYCAARAERHWILAPSSKMPKEERRKPGHHPTTALYTHIHPHIHKHTSPPHTHTLLKCSDLKRSTQGRLTCRFCLCRSLNSHGPARCAPTPSSPAPGKWTGGLSEWSHHQLENRGRRQDGQSETFRSKASEAQFDEWTFKKTWTELPASFIAFVMNVLNPTQGEASDYQGTKIRMATPTTK